MLICLKFDALTGFIDVTVKVQPGYGAIWIGMSERKWAITGAATSIMLGEHGPVRASARAAKAVLVQIGAAWRGLGRTRMTNGPLWPCRTECHIGDTRHE